MAYYIGIDLGGTNIKAGVTDETGHVLSKVSIPTTAEGGPDAVIANMAQAGRAVVEQAKLKMSQVDYIGVGAPGPIDFSTGVVRMAPNLPGWTNIPLQSRIGDLLGRPTMLENDGNAAAFGEYWAGAGRQSSKDIRHLIMLTLGTGVGSGLVVNGKIVHGSVGNAGEGGHIIVQPNGRQCGCGQRGCLETYGSASRTGQRAAEAVRDSKEATTLREPFEKGKEITAKMVFDHAKAGDKLARRVVEETVMYLAVGCVTLCRLFDPQMIVFAGGMILAGDYLFDQIRAEFHRQSWTILKDHVEIVPSTLGNDAGFIGAAAVAWDAHQNHRQA
jgi:glucokinase